MLDDDDLEPPTIAREIGACLAAHAGDTSPQRLSAFAHAVAALAPDLEHWCEAATGTGRVVLGLPGDRRSTIVGDVPPATGAYFIEATTDGGAGVCVRRCDLDEITGLACKEVREVDAGREVRRRRWTLAVSSRAVTVETQQDAGSDTDDDGEMLCRTLARALGWPVADDIPLPADEG